MHIELKDVLAQVREPDALEALLPNWEESEAAFPSDLPSFLTPKEFGLSREWSGLGPEADPVLDAAAHRIAASPALLHLAWHGYRLLFEAPGYSRFRDWPQLSTRAGYWAKPIESDTVLTGISVCVDAVSLLFSGSDAGSKGHLAA